ncbi:hypothetical protein GCM10010168_19480 [Actinoplanes ianthinogenes]|uniref:RCC1-like domain-containing protein n=2 Tax=Actinoplanes ianthinogenes TaxID=122358 RepID=A0ABM7M7G5_9ACTN|nr:hypothetical protein Aiant_82470 [Actinoplanes ianthinogenes]GGR02802.1 hypothetical protein GCM10010168_19480 [Actinoplanes ianthinogenes]
MCAVVTAAVGTPVQAVARTTVTLSAPSSGVADVAVAVKGTVRPAGTGRPVHLQEYVASSGKWVTRESGTTSRTGAYAGTFTTSAGTKTIRLYAPKSGTRPAGASASRKIVVVRQTVSLTMSAAQTEVNTQPTATITVSPKVARSVEVQRYTSGGWTTEATIKTNATTGTAVYYPSTRSAGSSTYRAVVAEQGRLKGLVSASRSLTVVRPVQFVQVTVGEFHTCGLGSDTATYCWGAGQPAPAPVAAPAGVSLTQLTAGESHTCGLGSDTATYCWGSGGWGQLGTGDTASRPAPMPVAAPPGVSFTQVTAGGDHTCALGSDTATYCWGRGEYGVLGNGGTADQPAPVPVTTPAGVTFTQVTAGETHTCALGSDTEIYCWGNNGNGQLGNGGTTGQRVPVPVVAPPGVSLTRLTAGGFHTCAQGSDATTYCWGGGFSGQLGNNDPTSQSAIPVPVAAPAGVTFIHLTTGEDHTCALGSDITAYCWGRGENGRLGNGGVANQPVPVPVAAPAGVVFTQLAAGEHHTCALGNDATTYCWGRGDYGQLGDGGTADQSSPVAVVIPRVRPAPDPTPTPEPTSDPVPDNPAPPVVDHPQPAPRPNPTQPVTVTVSADQALTSIFSAGSFHRQARVQCPNGRTAISGYGTVIYAESTLLVTFAGAHPGSPPSTLVTEWDVQSSGRGNVRVRSTAVCLRP